MASLVQKQKMLYLEQILREEADANHGLGWEEIIAKLEERNIKVERKAAEKQIEQVIEKMSRYNSDGGADLCVDVA